MKLYLVQHGEAVSKEVDPDRPLTGKGEADVDSIGRFMQQAGVSVQRIIHSGKRRAQQTAQRLATQLALQPEPQSSDLINPNDDPATFLNQSNFVDQDTLLVGHLPFMAKLVSYLLTGDEQQLVVAYQPGSVVCLERVQDSHWQLNWMLRPELLK